MKKIRVFYRAFLVFLMAITLIVPGLLKSFVSKNWLPTALRMRRLWARLSVQLLGVRLNVDGEIPQGGPYIFIGNHRSYVDPIIALRDVEALPVAKAEVSSWPVVGYCAKVTGIMWVKRESNNSRANTVKTMKKTLQSGFSVLVYPEGTTHLEPQTTTFKRGAFRISADLDIPVIPIGIDYLDKNDAWVGLDSFGAHFSRVFGRKHTYVNLCYGPPITGDNARDIMTKSKAWIDEWLIGQGTLNPPTATSFGETASATQ